MQVCSAKDNGRDGVYYANIAAAMTQDLGLLGTLGDPGANVANLYIV